MATLAFTALLRSVAPKGELTVTGASVREALNGIFSETPRLKGYVLDDQDRLRKHVCVFLDGERLVGNAALDAPISETSEIFVMQALSGG